MKKIQIAIVALCLVAGFAVAQQPEDPAHDDLRALRDGLVAAMNKGDIDAEVQFLHPNVVVTWHDATVSRGRDGVRAYLGRLLEGPGKVVEKFGAEVKVDELSILYGGDTAIAFGSAKEHFEFANRRGFDLVGRWTATLVREDGHWLVAALHASDDIFDNPLLNLATSTIRWVGIGALLIGIILGVFIGRRRVPRPAAG